MLDLKFVLANLSHVKDALAARGGDPVDLAPLETLNRRRKELQQEFDRLRNQQNGASADIARLKKAGQPATKVIAQMQEVAERIKQLQPAMAESETSISDFLLQLPNLPHATVPIGRDSNANSIIRTWGEVPRLDFKPAEHWTIGEELGILDFDRAAKLAGARFAVYRGAGARLERALINFMLDLHTAENGYMEVLPPFLVNAKTMTGTGQLPKFEADLFKTTDGYYLIPTAEVPLTNLYAGEVLAEADLPKRVTAYTPCFRSEAGSYGKDVKGLLRQHQFNKVELVAFAHPDHSYEELERLTANAEEVLKRLGLHYRVVTLCTGDMGFAAAKTYDIEVWLPGQNAYREISSCSNCEEFQARRANIRFKGGDGKLRYLHTLNGSGVAVGRTVIAIFEQCQKADGSVLIPEALRPYMGGMERINRES
ncbi:MAG: serine--tRNA ligase [Deltaproteobacteria bacterium]|nr:serine--tRNA ligase [Deltaproteobacteria bacterium]